MRRKKIFKAFCKFAAAFNRKEKTSPQRVEEKRNSLPIMLNVKAT